MKAGWKVKPLGDVCIKVQDGAHHSPKTTFAEKREGLFPYITSKNIRNEGLDLSRLEYVDFEFHQSIFPRCSPEFGDVLLTKDGANTGNVTLNSLSEPFSMLSSVALIKTARDKLLPEFLVYYLQSDAGLEATTGKMTGAAIKRIILKTLKTLQIPLPPLEEQQQIVAVLDEAFHGLARARAHAEANLRDARELFERLLDTEFASAQPNWTNSSLGSICTKIGSGATPRGGEAAYKAEGISLIRSLNIYDREFRLKNLAFLDDEQAEKLDGVTIAAGDVLLNITGASVARCAIVPSEVLPARVNQHVSIIRPRAAQLDNEFLCYFLTAPAMKAKLLQTGSDGGSTRQAITKADIQALVVHFPKSLDEQRAIVDGLKAAENETVALFSHYLAKIKDIDALRQSLLQKAFAGELR